MTEAAIPQSALVVGRLARLFLDCTSGVAPARCGVGPFAPDRVAAMAPAARSALAGPMSDACGLSAVELTCAHLARIQTEQDATHAGIIATMPADGVVQLARALAAIVYADLARRLVRKSDRELFHDVIGEPAAVVAIRRTPFHAALGALAPTATSIADLQRPDPPTTAPGGTDWELPTTSAVIAGEPPILRHCLAIIAAWVAAVEAELSAILRARFGDCGSLPELSPAQRTALSGFIARQLVP